MVSIPSKSGPESGSLDAPKHTEKKGKKKKKKKKKKERKIRIRKRRRKRKKKRKKKKKKKKIQKKSSIREGFEPQTFRFEVPGRTLSVDLITP